MHVITFHYLLRNIFPGGGGGIFSLPELKDNISHLLMQELNGIFYFSPNKIAFLL